MKNLLTVGSLVLAKFSILISLSYAQPIDQDRPLETSLASAYLYLISRTSWPEGAILTEGPVFCINRDQSLFDTFARLIPTFKLNGRVLSIKSFDEGDVNAQRLCNVIALGQNSDFNNSIISHVKGFPVLTISHEVDITSAEGIVFLAHGKRLEPPKINIKALEYSKLRIDASVLDLSRRRWSEE